MNNIVNILLDWVVKKGLSEEEIFIKTPEWKEKGITREPEERAFWSEKRKQQMQRLCMGYAWSVWETARSDEIES